MQTALNSRINPDSNIESSIGTVIPGRILTNRRTIIFSNGL